MARLKEWLQAAQARVRRLRAAARGAERRAAARRAGLRQERRGARRGRHLRRAAAAAGLRARSTTSTSASRSATCARRWRPPDVMAPCVLWIDEIEKGIATGDGDSGTSRRAARHLPDLAGGEEDAGVRRRHRQRHLGAAAGADPQGPLRRDLLRRPAGQRRCAPTSCASTPASASCSSATPKRRSWPRPATDSRARRSSRRSCPRSTPLTPQARTVGAPAHPAGDQGDAAAVGRDGGESRRAARVGGGADGRGETDRGRVRAQSSARPALFAEVRDPGGDVLIVGDDVLGGRGALQAVAHRVPASRLRRHFLDQDDLGAPPCRACAGWRRAGARRRPGGCRR